MERRQIRIYGIVQGVGFRPTVARHAQKAGVTGTVANRGSFVEVMAQGTADKLDLFEDLVRNQSPPRSVILKMDVKKLEAGKLDSREPDDKSSDTRELAAREGKVKDSGTWCTYADFRIVESEKTDGEIFISPDIAICDTCKKELYDRASRRYLHPFINCTCCGPRFSLLEALPYDRERTSMKRFPMCKTCHEEYEDPASRFYDAQPVCCKDCGPTVSLLEKAGEEEEPGETGPNMADRTGNLSEKKAGHAEEGGGEIADRGEETQSGKAIRGNFRATLTGKDAISRARQVLCQGGILAVKGIGGFHLACDATSQEAVEKLRDRKRRPAKPFAVMAKDEETAERECRISPDQRQILTGHQKPILLLDKKESGKVAPAVAPGTLSLGLMLPYAPIHLLLFTYEDEWQEGIPDLLVMTSGNVSGAPIASTDEEALSMIGDFCDAILTNDRDIRIRTDDSVMDTYEGEPYMVRRSRGYAPLPFLASRPYKGRVLGIGGELKNTFCLARDNIFYPSAYVGDLADVRTVAALKDAVHKTQTLLEMQPDLIVCDLHPRYNSGQVAEELGREDRAAVIRVQHHYAHILSCLAENDAEGPVIGLSLDGTGYGTDGTIWGGEILVSDLDGFVRAAHIRPFWQIGGDLSAREGWRIAVSMVHGLYEGGQEKGPAADQTATLKPEQEAVPKADQAADRTSDRIIEMLGLCTSQEAKAQQVLYQRKLNAVRSTSAGRLFDAAAAILGLRLRSTYEGEAATALMVEAMKGEARLTGLASLEEKAGRNEIRMDGLPERGRGRTSFGRRTGTAGQAGQLTAAWKEDGAVDVLGTDLLIRNLIDGRLAGERTDLLAYRFHRDLAKLLVQEAVLLSHRYGIQTAALSGGVFQNRLLLRMVDRGLQAEGIKVLRHRMVPPNDGGIGLGQALYGMRYLEKRTEVWEGQGKG